VTTLAFAGTTTVIRCEGAAAEELLQFVWSRHVRTKSAGADADTDADITLRAIAANRFLLLEAERHESDLDTAAALDALTERGTHKLARTSPDGLLFHAAVMARGSRAVLCPGLSGAGKSSLAMWLGRAGYAYLTDELAHLATGSVSVFGLARPLCFKPSAHAMLAGAFPDGLGGATMRRSATSLMMAPDGAGPSPSDDCAVRAIVFPRYAPASPLALRTITAGDAAIRLMSTLINTLALVRHGLPDVSRLSRHVPAFELSGDDFSGSAELIDAVLGAE